MLRVTVINPEEIVFQGQAETILAPGVKGMLGILTGHTPYYGELVEGDIIIEGPTPQKVPLKAGLIKVRADIVTILIGLE
jgi:F-type H+-transporting ATPase subunit epsilon